MSYELFVEVTRGGIVESRHFGAAVVCDYQGKVLESWGDVERLVFPRSALKPMQAINIVESGAADHFSLSDAEMAMTCSSHRGEPIHQDLITAWLDRLGLTQDHLACGAALPSDIESAHKLLTSGRRACRVHHNCSGKHTGFLTTALHLQMPLKDHHLVDHPLQQLALDTVSDVLGTDLRQYPIGVDGCGFPAATMPLVALARAVARFAKPSQLSDSRAQAIYRLHQALTQEPMYSAGHGTVVSELNQVTQGKILAKNGAEGVLTAALPEQGLGVALKIADGNARAVSAAMLAILDHLGVLSDGEKAQLHGHMVPPIMNSRDELVGEIRAAPEWLGDMRNASG